MLLSLVAAVLLLVLIGLALLLPYVPRLARAGAAMPEAVWPVEQAPRTLEQVERIDGNLQKVVPPVVTATEDLTQLAPQLAELNAPAQDLRATSSCSGRASRRSAIALPSLQPSPTRSPGCRPV